MKIRKIVTCLDEIHEHQGRPVSMPHRRAAAMAVIENPFPGVYQEDLEELIEAGARLGDLLTEKALSALGLAGSEVDAFGKAAIVGEAGELEHAAALLHPKMGAPLRSHLGPAPALVPSAKKVGTLGTAIDVPLGHKVAAYVRSHFDAMEVRVADAPRSGELVVVVALSCGGRPHARIGGLRADQVEGVDGLR